jgi:hypothetical protein
MKREVSNEHPIWIYFSEAIHDSLHTKMGVEENDDVEAYLTTMLVEFVHQDNIYGIRDAAGRPIEEVTEMVREGDIRLNADSFDREREVNRHIGDFLLFWSGVFPEFLSYLKAPSRMDALIDVTRQGQLSYHVASTFDHEPYTGEAEVLRRLSEQFEMYRHGLTLVRASFEGFARQGWMHGFDC